MVCAALVFAAGCIPAVRAAIMPLFLDPVQFLRTGVTPAVLSLACRRIAAYLVRVGATLGRVTLAPPCLDSCLACDRRRHGACLNVCRTALLGQGQMMGIGYVLIRLITAPELAPATAAPPPPDPPTSARGQSGCA